jgi:hypothetical protein
VLLIAAGDNSSTTDRAFRILAACGVTFVQLTYDSNVMFPFLFYLYPNRISQLFAFSGSSSPFRAQASYSVP